MNQLADYIIYLLQKIFDRKKAPLEWSVSRNEKELVKIWQYQVELEGGERHGPSFNHEAEASKFKAKIKPQDIGYRNAEIFRFWTYADMQKYRFVEPEVVK